MTIKIRYYNVINIFYNIIHLCVIIVIYFQRHGCWWLIVLIIVLHNIICFFIIPQLLDLRKLYMSKVFQMWKKTWSKSQYRSDKTFKSKTKSRIYYLPRNINDTNNNRQRVCIKFVRLTLNIIYPVINLAIKSLNDEGIYDDIDGRLKKTILTKHWTNTLMKIKIIYIYFHKWNHIIAAVKPKNYIFLQNLIYKSCINLLRIIFLIKYLKVYIPKLFIIVILY